MSISKSVYWLFQLIGWGSFAAINLFFAYFFEKMADAEMRYLALFRMATFVLLGLTSSHVMRAMIRRFNVVQKPLDRQFAYFFLLSVIFSLIPGALYTMAIFGWDLVNPGEKLLIDNPLFLVFGNSFYFFLNIVIWNLVYFIIHFVSASRLQQEQVWRLEEMMKEITTNNYAFQQEQN